MLVPLQTTYRAERHGHACRHLCDSRAYDVIWPALACVIWESVGLDNHTSTQAGISLADLQISGSSSRFPMHTQHYTIVTSARVDCIAVAGDCGCGRRPQVCTRCKGEWTMLVVILASVTMRVYGGVCGVKFSRGCHGTASNSVFR